MSIEELSSMAGASKASVVRFSRRLGFSGFNELKKTIQHELRKGFYPMRRSRRQNLTGPRWKTSWNCSDRMRSTTLRILYPGSEKRNFTNGSTLLEQPVTSILGLWRNKTRDFADEVHNLRSSAEANLVAFWIGLRLFLQNKAHGKKWRFDSDDLSSIFKRSGIHGRLCTGEKCEDSSRYRFRWLSGLLESLFVDSVWEQLTSLRKLLRWSHSGRLEMIGNFIILSEKKTGMEEMKKAVWGRGERIQSNKDWRQEQVDSSFARECI